MPTDLQAADLFTKGFTNVPKFQKLIMLNGVFGPGNHDHLSPISGAKTPDRKHLSAAICSTSKEQRSPSVPSLVCVPAMQSKMKATTSGSGGKPPPSDISDQWKIAMYAYVDSRMFRKSKN